MERRHETLRERLARYGQEHVLRFWPELDERGRDRLARQLERLDLELVARLVAEGLEPRADPPPTELAPPEVIEVPRSVAERARARAARARGEELLRRGRVAALTVAGGQGTRLGFPGPKGAFPIGPLSRVSLFGLFARRLRALRARYGVPLPWLVMVSGANEEATRAFFALHDNFGLRPPPHFFRQGTVPSVDRRGKLLLAAPDRVATNPNGHGGTLLALRDEGVLAQLEAWGIETLFYFQVDNPLVVICDPVFLGYHAEAGADMSLKVVEKEDPGEKVGLVVRRGERLQVIEYSDLDPELAAQREPDGRLRFRAGSIAIHAFQVEFVRRLTAGGLRLPYHRAWKRVPHVDAAGRLVAPAEPNAVKFETFVFDALPAARRAVLQTVIRAEEFSPVKNRSGPNSPATAEAALLERTRRWLRGAGAEVDRNARVEIDPLFALDAAEVARRVAAGTYFAGDCFLTTGPADGG